MSSSIQQFNDLVKTIPQENTLKYLHNVLGKQGVKVVYEKETNFDQENPVYDRLMFGTFNRSCAFEFQGTILSHTEGSHYKAISVPPPPPVTQYQSKILYKNFDKNTNIIKANDGTTVTLYYFKSKWVISTHRGFDVNTYICVAQKTYQDIIDEVLKQYPNFSYNNLDTSKCYTFGFNHSDFHPFMENREYKEESKNNVRAWFIQSVDLNKFNLSDPSYKSYTDDIGLPIQNTVAYQTLKQLFYITNNAYIDYVKNGTVNYGYLIKIGSRQYLVESSLLKNIRQIFYSNKFNQLEDGLDTRKYIIINSFLDTNRHVIFKTLFPQYIPMFDMMMKKMDALVQAIVCIYSYKDTTTFTPKNIVEIIAYELHTHIVKTVSLNNLCEKNITDIMHFVYNTKCNKLLYRMMYTE
jgi:hypothetical protein